MVFRIFVEKKPGLDNEAAALRNDIRELLQIEGIEKVRLFNRYDVENLAKDLFDYSVNTVFSEPQLDNVTESLPEADYVFAVEYLPGQFDQRASSAAECIQIITRGERPAVKTAKVYALYGKASDEEISAIKKYVINAVEAREADMALPETLAADYDIPEEVETLDGFRSMSDEELAAFIEDRGLAMDFEDIKFCRQYFDSEDRDPTITEIKMIDTYWSQSDYIFCRCCCNYGTYFHSLCYISRVVYFVHLSRGKSYLIAIGTVAGCCCGYQLSLRQFPRYGFRNRYKRISGTCDSHGCIYITPA